MLEPLGVRPVVDHQQRLAAALERVRLARGSREMSVVLSRELRDGVGAVTARVLVPPSDDASRVVGTFVDPHAGAGLSADTSLIDILRETSAPIDLAPEGPLRGLVPPQDRDWLTAHDVVLAASLKRRDGTIAAIVVCGPKRGGGAFDRRDRWLITTLISGAAAGWDVDGSGGSDSAESLDGGRMERRDEAAFECARCGVVMDSTPLPCLCGGDAVLASLPRHLQGKFVIGRRVGAGGMGVVYLARDTTIDRDVALKTLPDLREGTVARLRAEARAMAALNHESLATIYGVELWRHTPVLVVEYFPGGTLADRLRRGPMSPPAALALGVRLARALAYMHARGVLHRDLKPSNVALTATGAPKLMDFGLATLIRPSTDPELLPSRASRLETFAGTPAYLSPESYLGAPPDPTMDLWALSLVVLEAITGRTPFGTDVRGRVIHRAVHVDVASLCTARPDAAALLATFFDRALAMQPGLRFQTSVELESALSTLAGAFRDC